jgi:hypothetical protein
MGALKAKHFEKATELWWGNIMSENQRDEKKRFGLTQPEYDSLKDMLRYGIIIVVTVAITFVIVAVVSKMLGY